MESYPRRYGRDFYQRNRDAEERTRLRIVEWGKVEEKKKKKKGRKKR